jgi:hypothetical protein
MCLRCGRFGFDSQLHFYRNVCNGFVGHKNVLTFRSLYLFVYFISFFIHNREQKGRSCFLDVNNWKYTNILQQWSFTRCQNSFEHIRPGDKLAWFRIVLINATKTQTFATPRTSNQCFLAAFALVVISSARNATWFTLQKTSRDVISLAAYHAYLIIFWQCLKLHCCKILVFFFFSLSRWDISCSPVVLERE